MSIPALAKGKGGAERIGSMIANYWASRGENVAIVFNGKNKNISYPVDKGVQLFPSDYLCGNIAKLKQSREELLSFNADVVLIFYADLSLLQQYMIFRDFNCAIAAQECTNPGRAVRNIFRKFQGELSLKICFHIRQILIGQLAGVRFTIPDYKNSLIKPIRKKGAAFYNSFPLSNDLSKKISITRPRRMVCIGGLKDLNKNGLVAAAAFLSISQSFPNWELVYYGANNFSKELKELQKFPGGRRIRHLGFTNDIESMYLNSDFSIVCSFDEGNPNVVNEAMIFGIPTIGYSDCPGLRHLVKNKITGLLVNRNTEISGLAAAMSFLMENDTQRKIMGLHARRWAESHLDSLTYQRNWNDFIQKCYLSPDVDRKFDLENLDQYQLFLQNLAEYSFGIQYDLLYN